MPCSSSDGMGDAYRTDPTAQRMAQRNTDDLTRVKQHLDFVTALLCAQYRHMEDAGLGVPVEAKDWWEKHKAHDKKEGR